MSVGQEDRVSQVEQAGPVSEPVGVEGLPSGRQRRRPLVLVGFVGLVVLGALLALGATLLLGIVLAGLLTAGSASAWALPMASSPRLCM